MEYSWTLAGFANIGKDHFRRPRRLFLFFFFLRICFFPHCFSWDIPENLENSWKSCFRHFTRAFSIVEEMQWLFDWASTVSFTTCSRLHRNTEGKEKAWTFEHCPSISLQIQTFCQPGRDATAKYVLILPHFADKETYLHREVGKSHEGAWSGEARAGSRAKKWDSGDHTPNSYGARPRGLMGDGRFRGHCRKWKAPSIPGEEVLQLGTCKAF